MYNKELGAYVAVVSARRTQRVKKLETFLDFQPTWIVPQEEEESYRLEGANVIGVGNYPALSEARNAALERAFENDHICVLLDDDWNKVSYLDIGEAPTSISPSAANILYRTSLRPSVPKESLTRMLNLFRTEQDIYLAGAARFFNPLYSVGKPFCSYNVMIACCHLVKPSAPRFDPEFSASEDCDFSAQHVRQYGKIICYNREVLEFSHWSKGGIFDHRDQYVQLEMYIKLLRKWEGWIIPRSTCINNLLMHSIHIPE